MGKTMQLARLIFKDRSLWYKLTLLSVLPAVIVTIAVAFKVMGSMEKAMIVEARKKAETLTDLMRLSMSHPFVVYNKNLLDNFVDALGRIQSIEYATIVDSSDNRILAHNNHRLDGKLIHQVSDSVNLSSPSGEHSFNGGDTAGDYFAVSAPIVVSDKQYAAVHIGFSYKEVNQQMASAKRQIMLFAVLAVLVGVALSLFAAKLISTPIHGLARHAKLAGRGDFDQAIMYQSKDAIGELATAFNRMLADIKVKQRQLKAINTIADAVYHSLDIRTVVRNAVIAMMNYSQSPGVAIFAINNRQQQLEMIYGRGFDRQTMKKAAVLPMEGSLTGMAVQQKQVVLSTNIAADSRLLSDVRQALAKKDLYSAISIPLLARDRVLGAMDLLYKTRYDLSEYEKETLIAIGKTIGLAMDNARQMKRIQTEIEERKETEKALRESEDKYRNLVNQANDGILIIQDGLIRFANPSAVEMSGETAAGFINQPFTAYLHPDEKDRIKKVYQERILEDLPIAIYETVFVRKDGQLIYAEVNGNRTTYLDKPADLVIIRNISDRKQAQLALKRAHDNLEVKVAARTAELAVAKERAEESDRLKSAFLAAMSHELRTPLNSIIGFTGIILQRIVGPLNDEQSKQLTMVQDSAHHLLSLINDVLDLSKIEAGQLTIASEDFDLRIAIKKVVDSVVPMAQQKGLPIIIDIAPEIGTIVSDRRRVEQILLNLVNNAIKFTTEGQVTLRCRIDGDWISTEVQDTGIGIALEDSKKLFKSFQQIETGLSRRFEGTGLGLSICKKLVNLLGGEICAHSNGLGKGATFSFILPAGVTKQ
jgi:PAS domain S-box-containing protein